MLRLFETRLDEQCHSSKRLNGKMSLQFQSSRTFALMLLQFFVVDLGRQSDYTDAFRHPKLSRQAHFRLPIGRLISDEEERLDFCLCIGRNAGFSRKCIADSALNTIAMGNSKIGFDCSKCKHWLRHNGICNRG